MVETREEWEKKYFELVAKTRKPAKIKIHEMYNLYYRQGSARIGSFKRKARGREYVSPRILLRRYFKKHIGKRCEVLEGKISFEERTQTYDVLVLQLLPEEKK